MSECIASRMIPLVINKSSHPSLSKSSSRGVHVQSVLDTPKSWAACNMRPVPVFKYTAFRMNCRGSAQSKNHDMVSMFPIMTFSR